MPTGEMRLVLEMAEKEFPELWRLCYPRIYEEPRCGQYYSPKLLAHQLMVIAMKVQADMVGRAEQYEFIFASHMVKYRVPMLWIGHDMATAICKTMPPGLIHWYDMHMPFPACVFMLPKGTLVHPTEGDVVFAGYSRMKTGESHPSLLVKNFPYGCINGGMVFTALTASGQHFYHWNLPLDAYGPSVTLPDIDKKAAECLTDSSEHESGVLFLPQLHMSDEDNQMMLEVVHYVFSAMLIMQDRPDLVTRESRLRRITSKKGEHREFWSPNILGEHYRIRRQSADQGGTHASPRFHWVRGFHREQAYGQGRELRRQQWIEPYTRG